ncbi:MAG: hypothetical protein J0M29_14970 [Chitinophagales bacterium]|nr:hypothetical protein [Chitinophagales bacterium]
MKSIQMYDNHHELDSILIYVINPDSSLLYSKVEIGGQVYYIGSDGKKVGKNGSDSVILHGWQGDFAPIKLQSDSINTIRMTYSFIDREFCFAENSYFIDELFTLKNDTLTNLRFKYILKKCN